jgi:CBS domain-containing protein
VKVKVKDVPPGRLLLVEPQTTVAEVARLMRVDDCDAVAVISEGRLVGIVTEKDLVQAIADGVNPKLAKAEVIMSADPATVGTDEEVAVVAVKMTRLGIRHLPVVNQDGEPVGLLSARDLLAVLEKGGA